MSACYDGGMNAGRELDVVELMVQELRRRREELVRLFALPGQLVVHINLEDRESPVRMEARVRV